MIAPRTKEIVTIGHAFLPFCVKVKRSLNNPNRYYVEMHNSNGGCFDEVEGHIDNEDYARKLAQNAFSRWTSILTPAFEAGVAKGSAA